MKPAVTSAALLALLAAMTAVGAEGDAPLSGTKKELQQLQSDRGIQGAPSAKDGLKSDVPSLQVPVTSGPVYQRPTPEQQERETRQRKNAQKNWLIDGMANLESDAATKALLPGEDSIDGDREDDNRIDTSDPAYLLKLYDKQKKADDAKAAESKAQRMPLNNAFAPFLQDWMAASPVKDRLLSDMGRPTGGGTTSVFSPAAGAPSGVRGAVVLPDFNRDTTGPADKPNPYLSDSATSGAGPADGASLLLNSLGGAPASTPVAASSPAPEPLLPPVPPPVTSERNKAPPPPLADDRKHFPQLNKF